MDRRRFFRQSLSRVGDVLMEAAETKVAARASRWVRPPFALAELDFLLSCTRCGDCIEACPHQSLFPLSPRVGATAAATPALDLTHHACHLCEDWPCVTACSTGALRLPIDENDEPAAGDSLPMPVLARASIDESQCLPHLGPDCGACRSHCPIEGAMSWTLGRPRINADRCVGCGQCRVACISEPKAVIIRSLSDSEP